MAIKQTLQEQIKEKTDRELQEWILYSNLQSEKYLSSINTKATLVFILALVGCLRVLLILL